MHTRHVRNSSHKTFWVYNYTNNNPRKSKNIERIEYQQKIESDAKNNNKCKHNKVANNKEVEMETAV